MKGNFNRGISILTGDFFCVKLKGHILLQKKSIDLERNLGFDDIICGTASSFV